MMDAQVLPALVNSVANNLDNSDIAVHCAAAIISLAFEPPDTTGSIHATITPATAAAVSLSSDEKSAKHVGGEEAARESKGKGKAKEAKEAKEASSNLGGEVKEAITRPSPAGTQQSRQGCSCSTCSVQRGVGGIVSGGSSSGSSGSSTNSTNSTNSCCNCRQQLHQGLVVQKILASGALPHLLQVLQQYKEDKVGEG
jgi:hypothetical protein